MAQHGGDAMLDDLGVTAVDATDVEQNVIAQARHLVAYLSPHRRLASRQSSLHFIA
jgi:hypothetical protein